MFRKSIKFLLPTKDNDNINQLHLLIDNIPKIIKCCKTECYPDSICKDMNITEYLLPEDINKNIQYKTIDELVNWCTGNNRLKAITYKKILTNNSDELKQIIDKSPDMKNEFKKFITIPKFTPEQIKDFKPIVDILDIFIKVSSNTNNEIENYIKKNIIYTKINGIKSRYVKDITSFVIDICQLIIRDYQTYIHIFDLYNNLLTSGNDIQKKLANSNILAIYGVQYLSKIVLLLRDYIENLKKKNIINNDLNSAYDILTTYLSCIQILYDKNCIFCDKKDKLYSENMIWLNDAKSNLKDDLNNSINLCKNFTDSKCKSSINDLKEKYLKFRSKINERLDTTLLFGSYKRRSKRRPKRRSKRRSKSKKRSKRRSNTKKRTSKKRR